MKSTSRPINHLLLSSTALISAAMLMIAPTPAQAACDNYAPGAATFVTCTGADTTPIVASGNTVTVIFLTGASLVTAGNTITLNNNSNVIGSGTGVIQSTGGTAITMQRGQVILSAGDSILGGIVFTSSVSTVTSDGGTIDDILFAGNSNRYTMSAGSDITGVVDATSGSNDTLNLSGTVDGSFDTSEIGTTYLGFEIFDKNNTSAWTLTGSNVQNWTLLAGTLTGTTANLGNIANSSGSVLRIDQAANGTYANVLSGAGALQKTGAGNVTLSSANTYTGTTTISGGTLTVNADNNLGNAGGLNLNSGGILNFGTAFSTNRTVALSSGNGVVNTTAGTTTLSGVVSGAGRLVKTGTGVLVLSNNGNSYGGGTHIDGAGSVLQVNTDARLGDALGNIEISNGGTLRLNGAVTSARNIILSSGDAYIEKTGIPVVLSGTISGSGKLITSGNHTLTLSGTNTYSGGTDVSALSTLQAMSDASLGNTSGNIALNSGFFIFGTNFNTARDFAFSNVNPALGGLIATDFNNTISGDLSGTGLVAVSTGVGASLTLTGTSTKTGGFSITAGTLIGTTGNLTGNIANAGSLVFNQTINDTYSGVISGAGSLTKDGAGTLTLSGVNTYTGATTVTAGRLAVNGSIASSAVTVGAGGNLGGAGTVGALTLNGILAPGNSIDTLSAGNTVFNAGSTYEVEIDDGLNSDLLAITGTLDIDPGASVVVDAAAGTYVDGSLYTIITNTGARTGTFGGLTHNLAFLTPSLVYNANSVQLLLNASGASFTSVCADSVQCEVAIALEHLGAGNTIYDAFSGLTVNSAYQALDDLSGEHLPGIAGAMSETNGLIRSVLSTRMQALSYHRGNGEPISAALAPATGNDFGVTSTSTAAFLEPASGDAPLRDAASRVWLQTFGTTGQSVGRATSSQQTRGSSGLIGGIDAELSQKTYIGLFGGYELGEVNTDSERASTELNNYHAGAYATRTFDLLRLSGGLGGTYHDITTKRYVAFPGFSEDPESETSGYTANGFIEVGHPFAFSNDLALEPFIGVSVSYSHMDGYTETNGGAANLRIKEVTALTPAHVLGVRAGRTITTETGDTYNLSGTLGWQHSYGDLADKTTMQFEGGSTDFTTYGPGRTRDAALVGLGIDAKIGDSLTAFGGYNGTLSKDAQDHALTAGIKISF